MLVDPSVRRQIDPFALASRSRNTPFHGWELKGRAVRTIVAGETVGVWVNVVEPAGGTASASLEAWVIRSGPIG